MRTDKGYKITLQFPAKTLEQRQAGEFLERLGSKKSRVVVQALTEYLQKYPDLLEVGGNIEVAAVGITKEDVMALIRAELARGCYAPPTETTNAAGMDQEDAVAALLDNIGLFG